MRDKFVFTIIVKTLKEYIKYGVRKHGNSWLPDFCDQPKAMKNQEGFVAIYRTDGSYRHFFGSTKREALTRLFNTIKPLE